MKKQKNPSHAVTYLTSRKKEGKLVFDAQVFPDGSGRCTLLDGEGLVAFDAAGGKIKDWVKEVRSQQRIYSALERFLEELTEEFAKSKADKSRKGRKLSDPAERISLA